jgi:hypothetical protein
MYRGTLPERPKNNTRKWVAAVGISLLSKGKFIIKNRRGRAGLEEVKSCRKE